MRARRPPGIEDGDQGQLHDVLQAEATGVGRITTSWTGWPRADLFGRRPASPREGTITAGVVPFAAAS
jgi:hypothetical protein